MNEHLYRQFEMSRNYFLKSIGAIAPEILDIQPEGYNNTIHWHIGHVLTVTEQFVFGFPQKSAHLPERYIELFGNGTKPADWKGEVPTVEELHTKLEEQLARIKEVPEELLEAKLAKPLLGLETHRELVNMAIIHEANHLGQLHAIELLINRTSNANN